MSEPPYGADDSDSVSLAITLANFLAETLCPYTPPAAIWISNDPNSFYFFHNIKTWNNEYNPMNQSAACQTCMLSILKTPMRIRHPTKNTNRNSPRSIKNTVNISLYLG